MLEACLESAAQLDPRPREVIVTIDGCDGEIMRAAEGRGFRVVTNDSAPGVSATRNAGAKSAADSILVFADSDVQIPRDFIARAVAAFAAHPEAAAVIGSYDDAPAAPRIISRYRNLLHHYTHQNGSRDARTFWAGCGAIRRDVFLSVGGFDESYRLPSVEDIDLGYRLRKAGHRIRLVPDWQVKHLKQWTFADLIFTDIGRRAIPWTRLLEYEGRLDNDLNIDHRSRLSAGLVCAGLASTGFGFFWRPALLVGVSLLVIATAVNWKFYRFLASRVGWPFAIACVPLHWIYFSGAAIGYVIGKLSPGTP